MLKLLRGFVRSKLQKRPVLVSHLLTQKCNLNCPYCIWKDNSVKAMSTEEIMRVHSDLAKNGFVGCFLWGGEPLLRDDIKEILEHDKSLGWFVSMATNGSFLSSKAEIIAKNVDHLLVSIDFPGKTHDKIRQGRVFDAALKGIRKVKEKGTCKVSICSVLSRYNQEAIQRLAELAKEENCTWIVQHMDIARNSQAPECDLTQDERDKVIKQLIVLKKQGYPIANSYAYLEHFRSPAKRYSCKCQFLYLTIWPDGQVISCVDGTPIANILEKPVSTLLKSERYREFLNASTKCARCRDAGTLESTFLYSLKLESILTMIREV